MVLGTIGNTIGTNGNANGTIGSSNGTIGKPMTPLSTISIIGKITNGTIGRTPNGALIRINMHVTSLKLRAMLFYTSLVFII